MSHSHITDMPQEAEEGDSQDSLKDSTISFTDFDPMDDTIASQQTAATETSQPSQSAVSMVNITFGFPPPLY